MTRIKASVSIGCNRKYVTTGTVGSAMSVMVMLSDAENAIIGDRTGTSKVALLISSASAVSSVIVEL